MRKTYLHSLLEIPKHLVQVKKMSSAKAGSQAVTWKVSAEGETLVLQSRGKQRKVSSDWEPGVRINSANGCFQGQVMHVWNGMIIGVVLLF